MRIAIIRYTTDNNTNDNSSNNTNDISSNNNDNDRKIMINMITIGALRE